MYMIMDKHRHMDNKSLGKVTEENNHMFSEGRKRKEKIALVTAHSHFLIRYPKICLIFLRCS